MAQDLQREFEQAAEDVRHLGVRPNQAVLLKLYALYKQASVGDATGAPPGFFDFASTARHEAWADLQGLPPEEAKRRYIALVSQLLILVRP